MLGGAVGGQPLAEPVADWPGKWLTSAPSPMHWYSPDRLERLAAAYIDRAPDMPVRDFLLTFSGMVATARQRDVLGELGLARQPVSSLQNSDGAVDRVLLARLHEAVAARTKPVRAARLGRIGEPAFARLGTVLAYACKLVEDPCAPAVVEAALIEAGEEEELGDHVLGINFTSPAKPGFAGHEDRLGRHQLNHPDAAGRVRLVAHIACPAVTFADRGKRQATLPWEVEVALAQAVSKAARPWEEEVKRAIRRNRPVEMKQPRSRRASTRDAAFEAMEAAYMKASAHGTLPAAPRQIMYAARPTIEEATGKPLKTTISHRRCSGILSRRTRR